MQPSSPSPYIVEDQATKASALLNSVVDSIKDHPTDADIDPTTPTLPADDLDVSPTTRRNRDLAHVLFGTEDDLEEEDQQNETIKRKVEPAAIPLSRPFPVEVQATPPPTTAANVFSGTEPARPMEQKTTSSSHSPYLLRRNPSAPRIPHTPQEEADLARQVQQKTEAAMIALNKNPSHVNLGDGLKHTTSVRRKVDTSQISTPTLLSTTTSVEMMPLRSPSLSSNNSGPSKLGSRFRKLRGSLRAKTASSEESVIPDTTKSPPVSQVAHYDPTTFDPPGAPKLSSATDSGRFKVPLPNSPPASAGPGLKGFMARFRNKQRMSEMSAGGPSTGPRATSPLSPVPPLSPGVASPLTPRYAEPTTPKQMSLASGSLNLAQRPPGQPRPMYSRFPPATPAASPPPAAEPIDGSQSAHLAQLFSAANKLGLDENALSDLLARSGSTSSRNHLSRNTSNTAGSGRHTEWQDIQQVSYVGSTGSDQTATPTNYSNALSESQSRLFPAANRPNTPEASLSRKPSARKPEAVQRRPREGLSENAVNAVVRRTIIYANDILPPTEIPAAVQRKNSSRRRRVSVSSVSARSVHDRAPTPPPPKSPTVKRFSADGLPPMPQMPNFLGQAGQMLNAPSTSTGGPIEKSNSTHDSL